MEETIGGREKRAEYPWQLGLPPWAPAAKKTEAERRADHARHMIEWEERDREEGMVNPLLFYDERRDPFRFSDGTFALSRDHANWPALKQRGFFRWYGM